MSPDADLGPNERRGELPTSAEIAREVARVGRQNGVAPVTVVVFGSYANDDPTPSSDADVVVVSPDFEEDDVYARRFYWDWDWNHDEFPTLDLIPLRPDEFREFSSRSGHIAATAVTTGDVFEFGDGARTRPTTSRV
ncbi:nucleotidyltransferase domain-containing protein [Halorussus pelagicus]|uniref:nucleotidyltransferase domain-containing protein n=1 Tax=Halorussus pelagicus TaxID=2505977 RepID=UPI00140C1129|nr:nucleotidyltransferase domain-containing protein [Halorussus pelagicus]